VAGDASSRADDLPNDRVVVRFERGGGAQQQGQFAAAVRAELAGIAPVDVVAPGTLVVVRVTFTSGGARLDFEDVSGAAIAPPRTIAGGTLDVVAAQAASIVRGTAIALRESAALGKHDAAPAIAALGTASASAAPRPAATAPAPAPPPAAESPTLPTSGREAAAQAPVPHSSPSGSSPPRISVSAFYAGEVYAAQVPWRSGARVEVLASVARLGPTWLYAGLDYGFDPPVDVSTPDVTLATSRNAASLRAGLGHSFNGLRLAFKIGPEFTSTLRTATTSANGFAPTGDHALLSLGAIGRARAAILLSARSHVDLVAGLALFPWADTYVVQGRGDTTVFAPYRVQPELALGLGYDVW
jgi:hypothetical protein